MLVFLFLLMMDQMHVVLPLLSPFVNLGIGDQYSHNPLQDNVKFGAFVAVLDNIGGTWDPLQLKVLSYLFDV